MGWRRFFRRNAEPDDRPEVTVPPGARTATHGGAIPRPPRPGAETATAPTQTQRDRRIADLHRRREALLFDLDQGELALQPDNPWQQRIDLLTAAIATVDADLALLAATPPEPGIPLPPTEIAGIQASAPKDGEATVRFSIGGERFVFGEAVDWDQRGGAVVRGDLRQLQGDSAALVPGTVPAARASILAAHLADSVFVFATDLRDRALAGTPLPSTPTLADLAKPCPICGGWRDWRGRCPTCTAADQQRQGLRTEVARLERDRAAEGEDRHRWIERLPIARRRLADVDADLAALGSPAER